MGKSRNRVVRRNANRKSPAVSMVMNKVGVEVFREPGFGVGRQESQDHL